MQKACTMQVHGRVQGVGFRFYTVQAARVYHITGWVRNDCGGTVSIFAQGEERQLDLFTEAVRKGPDRKSVV